ncbi:hypothetical protein POM88_013218 [Heracleum sosnowskyi]|uniref:Uncharacterized protein n=1 Tax=Heracleum sosnowskyi TaxID=360622 RepID=A0AAD8IXY5_9APIA|nr:hypothetical protein POM88_013218 [Heracleum sosnowskyi]
MGFFARNRNTKSGDLCNFSSVLHDPFYRIFRGLRVTPSEVCENEKIDFVQKKSSDALMIKLKTGLYKQVLNHQSKTHGTETLAEIMAMKSRYDLKGPNIPKVTVIFNHFKRKTLCAQLESLLHQTLPFHHVWENVAGTEKYKNSVLGSIGRILPFRQKDFTFPSYRKFRSKEAGLYLPDPAYDITVDKIVKVDFLSSSWFLSADLIKTLFIEKPMTFMTGEDLHLSYRLQKYRNAGSFVLPVDPKDKETWGDSEHRLAYVSETTVIFKDIVQVRDDQWWKALSTGYITQWAAMYPQKIDALFYAHTVEEVKVLAPLLEKFRSTVGKKAYIAVSGGNFCPCADAASALNWPLVVCRERRFKIFDLEVGDLSGISNSEVPVVQAVYASMKGLIKMHNPSVVITVNDIDPNVMKALKMATETNTNGSVLILLPRSSVSKVLWMADLRATALPNWNRMRISVNIITQNRVQSLTRLLNSLSNAYYLGDEVPISFNMDSKVDERVRNSISKLSKPSKFFNMEPGAHISAKDNVVKHDKSDFEVPLLKEDFRNFLPNGKMPPASKLPSLNLFNQAVSLKGLKAAGAKLRQDVIGCNVTEIVHVDHDTGLPSHCAKF